MLRGDKGRQGGRPTYIEGVDFHYLSVVSRSVLGEVRWKYHVKRGDMLKSPQAKQECNENWTLYYSDNMTSWKRQTYGYNKKISGFGGVGWRNK